MDKIGSDMAKKYHSLGNNYKTTPFWGKRFKSTSLWQETPKPESA